MRVTTRSALAISKLQWLAFEASNIDIRRQGSEHSRWKTSVEVAISSALPPASMTLRRFRDIEYLLDGQSAPLTGSTIHHIHFGERVDEAVGVIEAAIFEIEMLDALVTSKGNDMTPELASADAATVFVVHGHDESHKFQVVRLIERATSREAVILHEAPNNGATLLEKFERHAATAAFAVVILTADDLGTVANQADPTNALKPRGRQNVVFELGFFFGQLGRTRVAVLHESGIELPSDLHGLGYIELDSGGGWKQLLARELAAAGIEVDFGRIP